MLYVLTTGCQWRFLPTNFPPYTTVQRFFYGWRDDGTWRRINQPHLLLDAREAAGREASPSAGVIDSQSVRTTESGGPRGYDAGKKIKGRKRHILTETMGCCDPPPPCTRRTSRIATGRCRCWQRSATRSHGCATSSPMAATPGPSSKRRWPRSAPGAGDRQAIGCRQGLRAVAAALGGRTHAGLARPQDRAPRQGDHRPGDRLVTAAARQRQPEEGLEHTALADAGDRRRARGRDTRRRSRPAC